MRYLLFFFFAAGVVACSIPKLSIARKDIGTTPIKTQGFYYNRPDIQNFILYQNGVFLGDYAPHEKNIDSVAEYWTNKEKYKYHYNLAYSWGLFEIQDRKINIEHWESREWAVYAVTKYSGIVLNDSMLLLDHPVVGRDTFYFHYLPVKPDSTNKFIK